MGEPLFPEGYATGGFFTVELKELPDLVEFALRQPPTRLDES
jgi:hypothetical protein